MTTKPKVRYEDIYIGDNPDLKITDADGETVRGLKVPRSLFVETSLVTAVLVMDTHCIGVGQQLLA